MPDPEALTASPPSPVASLAATPSPAAWPYPGTRWWSFDFHAHTPASSDTPHWHQAIGTDQEVTPERCLGQFMAAGIDCAAITDQTVAIGSILCSRQLASSPWRGRTSIALFRQRQALARRWARLGREG